MSYQVRQKSSDGFNNSMKRCAKAECIQKFEAKQKPLKAPVGGHKDGGENGKSVRCPL